MVFSTALGFGVLASFLYSLKDIPDDPTFVFSLGTVIVFALGALAGWLFWRLVERKIQRQGDPDQNRPRSEDQ